MVKTIALLSTPIPKLDKATKETWTGSVVWFWPQVDSKIFKPSGSKLNIRTCDIAMKKKSPASLSFKVTRCISIDMFYIYSSQVLTIFLKEGQIRKIKTLTSN